MDFFEFRKGRVELIPPRFPGAVADQATWVNPELNESRDDADGNRFDTSGGPRGNGG
ncbi:hypothetical protein Q9R30_00305 [Arthrobacter sp. AB6]|uniref:hypothetical protein n=1 Tax=Arthrobacter sp. AB6 TaxID=2962570 RepID=UPI002881B8F4|nr:hypothetical protein [Arthrobacter sp. AB6]MDT0193793.1 hypothetical protein [Arthrobacter sp. AB6]